MTSPSVDYQLVRSKRRSLSLRVLENGVVQVRAPQRLARRHIERFVHEQQAWIAKQQARMAALPRQRWCSGERLAFNGEQLVLQVQVLAAQRKNARVERKENTLTVYVPMSADEDNEVQVQAAVEKWLREQARLAFEASIDRQLHWFTEQGYARPVLRVKKMRTRWGSLSARGYINLNMALMHYPQTVQDYVVMHELCHLVFAHHGAEFHALMDARMPDWRVRKQVLDETTLLR